MLPPNNRKGSGFTNINRVVTANQGNKLGSTVASGVQNQANQVKSQTQNATTNFNTEAQKSRLDTEDAAKDRDTVIGRFTGPDNNNSNTVQTTTAKPFQPTAGLAVDHSNDVINTGKTSGVSQGQVDPGYYRQVQGPNDVNPVVNGRETSNQLQGPTDQELSNFNRYRTGTYEGPNQLQDFQSLAGKAQNTEMLGDLSRSTGGRAELLKRFVGGAGYNQGQQGLDNLLLGQSGNALNQTRRATQGLSQDVAGANTQASNLAQEYANRAKIFGQDTVTKLGAARDPISAAIDAQLKANQGIEDTRLGNVKSIQDILSGTGDDYKNLDRVTRLGLGLQSAKDSGYLTDTQANQLLGDGGLIQRAEQLGLNTNDLINERIKSSAAQNLTRGGAASGYQESQLNALDRLSGKQGTGLEFNQPGADFQQGSAGLDTDTLNDYLNTTEKAKNQHDAAKMAEQEAYNNRYMNQAMAGGQQAMAGGMQLAGAGLNQTLNPSSYYDPREIGGNISNAIQGAGAINNGMNSVATQGTAGLLEGLTKLNIGGNSLANTEGGKQLLKAINMYSQLGNQMNGVTGNYLNGVADSVNQLGHGNITQAAGTYLNSNLNIAKNLNSTIADEIARGAAGQTLGNIGNAAGNVVNNIGSSIGNAVSGITGGGIKISDEDLKTNIDYDSKHIDDFLNKLKPASYEYKDEVKNSPFASKGMELGVMAQDLEKSKAGKEAVIDTDEGKIVDYDSLQPKMLAALASLNEKVNKLESKKKK